MLWTILPMLLAAATPAASLKTVETPVGAAPTAVVDRQIAAYAARDIGAFMVCFDPDAVIHILTMGRNLTGTEAIRAVYGRSFSDKSERRDIALVGRLTYGPYVTDHEAISSERAEALVIYEVRKGRIREVWIHQTASR